MERTQFTFYDSFYRAVGRIRSKAARCDAYDALCRYALTGEEPDLEKIHNTAAIVFEMVKPNLEASRRKAEAGTQTHGCAKPKNRKTKTSEQAEQKLSVSCQEAVGISTAYHEDTDSKNKNKDKNKIKNKDNSLLEAAFERFWNAYPRKEGRQRALDAFAQAEVPLDTLLCAIEAQKRSDQWQREGGRFIPSPANWLNGRRWMDQLPVSQSIPKGASGVLGEAELEAIERMMANKRAREGQG